MQRRDYAAVVNWCFKRLCFPHVYLWCTSNFQIIQLSGRLRDVHWHLNQTIASSHVYRWYKSSLLSIHLSEWLEAFVNRSIERLQPHAHIVWMTIQSTTCKWIFTDEAYEASFSYKTVCTNPKCQSMLSKFASTRPFGHCFQKVISPQSLFLELPYSVIANMIHDTSGGCFEI